MSKKDLFIVSIIGFLVGWLVLLPAANLGVKISPAIAAISVLFFSVLAPILLAFLHFLSRFFKVLEQAGKFLAVGTLNTLLDISVLNGLIYLTGIARGWHFTLFKATAFLIASTNSYFWNKFWTFESYSKINPGEYFFFFLVTLFGAFINTTVASFIVNVLGAPAGFSLKLWANVAALIAVFFSMLWNFSAYRYIVFKKRTAANNDKI
jgi:putative flippase GtrA